MADGSNRHVFGWMLAVFCWVMAIVMMSMPSFNETGNGIDSDGDGIDDNCDPEPNDPFSPWDGVDDCEEEDSFAGRIGSGACCCLVGFMFLGIADSGKKAKAAAASQIIFVAQQPAQQVVHHHTTHTYVPQKAPVVQQPPVSASPTPPAKSQTDWLVEATNMEKARNWEGAAMAYEKAGRYDEAGRVRQAHLEKDESQVKINIDRIGDNIQDSVVMKDGDSQNDPNQP